MQPLPNIPVTIPATEAPTDLSRARLAIVVGNQIMSVPAEGIGASFGFQPSDAALTSFAGVSWVAGDILYFSGADTAARLAKGTALQHLRMNAGATAPEWASYATIESLEGLTLVAGDILYATGADTLTKLAKGTALQVLRQNSGLTAPEWATAREVLTANRTYYVRTDGSDSNDGSANTSGSAFLTLQKAVNVILTLDLNGFDVTIAVADGTYTGATIITKNWVGGTVIISGSTSAILSVTSNHVIATVVPLANLLSIVGLKLTTTTAGDCIRNSAGGTIWFTGTEFGACAANHINADAAGAIVECRGSYTITGGATNHVIARYGGFFRMTSRTATLSGTPAFSTAFANATTNGTVLANGSTFSGAATGKRYQTDANAVINSGGGGASHFPGSVAGTTATGGQYI